MSEGILQEIKNHATYIISNRREDGGECDNGAGCRCSEHEALCIILGVNALLATPTPTVPAAEGAKWTDRDEATTALLDAYGLLAQARGVVRAVRALVVAIEDGPVGEVSR